MVRMAEAGGEVKWTCGIAAICLKYVTSADVQRFDLRGLLALTVFEAQKMKRGPACGQTTCSKSSRLTQGSAVKVEQGEFTNATKGR